MIERAPAGLSKRRALWAENPEAKHTYLEPDEIDALRDEVPDRYKALIEVLAWGVCGSARRSRDDVLLRRNQLLVNKSQSEVGATLRIERPKNRRTRCAALGQESMRVLRDHLQRFAEPAGDARIFTTSKGLHLRYADSRNRVLATAAVRVAYPNLTPQGLRSTCATNLFALGWQVKDVQKQLGHATAQITLDIYTEFVESGRTPNVARIDDIRRQGQEGA